MGLNAVLQVPNDVLTDVSDAYIRETQQLEVMILAELRAYDRETLTQDQQLSFDIYEWYLDDRIRGHTFMYYDYPVNPILTGVQNQMVLFLSDLHPIRNEMEAEDYLARLWLVEDKFDQVVEGLQLREQAGVVLPDFLLRRTLEDLNRLVRRPGAYRADHAHDGHLRRRVRPSLDVARVTRPADDRSAGQDGRGRAFDRGRVPAIGARPHP